MSVKRFDTFTLICDWPDCGADVCEGSDYSGWGDVSYLEELLSDYDWWHGVGGEHFCSAHPATWASDHEKGEAFPEPPYLLIHDGDTDDSDDDGKVSLIGGES